MYKIYINHTPLLLVSADEFAIINGGEPDLSILYMGNKKRLHNIVDLMEKGTTYDKIIIRSNDLGKLWSDFKSIFKKIHASGGIVFNEAGNLLLIFRRGYWDLPKGKIEKGEKKKEGAMREVREECGIKNLRIVKKAGTSYHVYREKKKRILKKSIWYIMYSNDILLKPQIEEDIEEVRWVDPIEFLSGENKIYPSLADLLTKTDFGFWKREMKSITKKNK